VIINEFVRKKFNEYKPITNLLILENENINIYESIDEEIIIEQSINMQFQMLEILEIVVTEPQNVFKIQLPYNKIGFIKPHNSVVVIPKRKKQVRINNDVKFNNPLNIFIGIDEKYFEKNKHRVVFSSYYAVFQNEVYQCLIYIDEIIAFVKESEINIMHRYEKKFKIIADTTIYRNATMTKPVRLLYKGNTTYTSQYVIIEEEKVRIKYKGKIYWIKKSDTDLIIDIDHERYADLNELLLDSILYQNSLKLENYHQYYHKLLMRESNR